MSDLLINAAERARLDVGSLQDRATPDKSSTAFGDILGDAINQVNSLQSQAGEEVQRVMTGENTDIHTAMIAVQKADVSFQMMMQVRNKLVSAYQEIMKLQV
jgi:flagellar hook-basal body complex protein FliE